MHKRLLPIAIAAMGLAVLAARVEGQSPLQTTGTVTILTDSIVEPKGRATLAVNELAERLGRTGKIRVLPVAGSGAVANVRDLLSLRGIDLAILNSDILAHIDQRRQYPDARRRIRQVTHLFDQQVYLLVRKKFKAIEDLRAHKLVVLSRGGSSHITAMTLFGLQNVDVELEPLGSEAILNDAGLGKFDGALLLSGELARVRLGSQAREEFHLLPIPVTPPLQKAYRSMVIEAREISGLADAAKVDTVAVSTLLAAFDWSPSSNRYRDVRSFISAFYSALQDLRQQGSGSIWRQVDVSAAIPGWTRYSAAEPRGILKVAQLADLAAVERPRAALPRPAENGPEAAQKPKIRLLATGRAPLADERLPEGGLVTALVRSSLGKTGQDDAALSEIDVRWTKSALPPIQSLLSDRSIDISLPWESADCEQPNDLMQASAVLCDNALYTDPILQVVIGVFTLSDSAFKFDTDESILGKTICIPNDRDVSVLNVNGRNWLSQKRVVVLRQQTLLDCVSSIQKHEADAFIANDLEGRYVLARLGLAALFRMAERPLGMRGVHAIVSKDHAQASELVGAVNSGLKRLKQSDAYAAIVRKHLMRLWDAP
jgi:uncharacterized protein